MLNHDGYFCLQHLLCNLNDQHASKVDLQAVLSTMPEILFKNKKLASNLGAAEFAR
jgi:hypothetical protein